MYEPGKLPRIRQMWYCVMDVRLPQAMNELVAVVENNTPPTPEEVRDKGWLPNTLLEKIRDLIKEDVARTSAELEGLMNDTAPGEEEF